MAERAPTRRLLRTPRPTVLRLPDAVWGLGRLAVFLRAHPWVRRGLVIVSGYAFLITLGANTVWAAETAGADSALSFFLPVAHLTDTHGVPVTQYATLPLDRGGVLEPVTQWLSMIIDFVWTGHFFYVLMLLSLLDLVLSFQWVELIGAPIEGIATAITSVVGTIGWVPMALAATGAGVGILVIRGRHGAAVTEAVVAAVLAALMLGPLANPVSLLTGQHGLLASVHRWGGELSLMITNDGQVPLNPDGSAQELSQALNTTVLSQMVDTYIRHPAQVISFGHQLTGDCDERFTDQLTGRDPLAVDEDGMREAITGCDAVAGQFASAPLLVKPILQGVLSIGAFGLTILALVLIIFLFWCVLNAFYCAVKALITGLLAILPGSSRAGFLHALISTYLEAFLLVVGVVVLASYLEVINDVTAATSSLGITLQMVVVTILVLLFCLLLLMIRRELKKKGKRLAELLSTKTGRQAPPRPSRVRATVKHLEPWAREAFFRSTRHPRPTPGFHPTRTPPPGPPPAPWSVPRSPGQIGPTPPRPALTGPAAGTDPTGGGGPSHPPPSLGPVRRPPRGPTPLPGSAALLLPTVPTGPPTTPAPVKPPASPGVLPGPNERGRTREPVPAGTREPSEAPPKASEPQDGLTTTGAGPGGKAAAAQRLGRTLTQLSRASTVVPGVGPAISTGTGVAGTVLVTGGKAAAAITGSGRGPATTAAETIAGTGRAGGGRISVDASGRGAVRAQPRGARRLGEPSGGAQPWTLPDRAPRGAHRTRAATTVAQQLAAAKEATPKATR